MPRFIRYSYDWGNTGPSSKRSAIASCLVAPHTTRFTPAQSAAPRHMAHGSQDEYSVCDGCPGAASEYAPTFAWARMNATISACNAELRIRTTLLTPRETNRPDSDSKIAAPNGPPVTWETFAAAISIATRIRSSSVA